MENFKTWEELILFLENSLELAIHEFGEYDDETLNIYKLLRDACRNSKKYDKAEFYANELVNHFEARYGKEDLKTADANNQLSAIYFLMEDYSRCIDLNQKILKDLENDPEKRKSYDIICNRNIGISYRLIENYEESIDYLVYAIHAAMVINEIRAENLGELNYELGLSLEGSNQIEYAIQSYKYAIHYYKSDTNNQTKYIKKCFDRIIPLLNKAKRFEESILTLEEYLSKVESDNIYKINLYEEIARLNHNLRRHEIALDYYKYIIDFNKLNKRTNHITTVDAYLDIASEFNYINIPEKSIEQVKIVLNFIEKESILDENEEIISHEKLIEYKIIALNDITVYYTRIENNEKAYQYCLTAINLTEEHVGIYEEKSELHNLFSQICNDLGMHEEAELHRKISENLGNI
jgi:hypothetical protein